MRLRLKKMLPSLLLVSLFLPVLLVNAATVPTQATIKPVKILLVPGHDNVVWGARYGNMKEATMTLSLATQIYNILKKDKRFDVEITRDGSTPLGYTQEFADYFTNHWSEIVAFEKNDKANMQASITDGAFIEKANPPHHMVSQDVALRLYGMNKWADDNNVDAMVHIHFNGYPLPSKWAIGKYTGFAIYVPEGQMANSKESDILAKSIYTQLKKKYATSTYKPEKGGLVPDQSLIALGSNGTLLPSVRSVLIEYGYIYEKKFRTTAARNQAYANMAQLTAAGIQNYFFPK